MIKDGLCDSVIVVTPNFYSEIRDKDHKISDEKVAEYAKENEDEYLQFWKLFWRLDNVRQI